MKHKQQDVKLGRFLSLILRHDPSAVRITLDEKGWADVDQLLAGMKQRGHLIDKNILERIVSENNKQRYSFNEDHTKIRANQGHSINIDAELEIQIPPDILYHGTADGYMKAIMKEGLKQQTRQHVHLSTEITTAKTVGSRHGKPVILSVDAAAMNKDGHTFWLSKNKVWLCKNVPVKYLQILQ